MKALLNRSAPTILTTILLIIIEFCYITLKSPALFSSQKVYSSLSNESLSYIFLNNNFYYFLTIFILSHTFLAATAIYLSNTIEKLTTTISKSTSLLISILLVLNFCVIINSLLFTNSMFSIKKTNEFHIFLSSLLAIATILIFAYKTRILSFNKSRYFIVISIIIISFLTFHISPRSSIIHTPSKKNIIIFSIDSLRPDILDINNPSNSHAPFFSQSISNSHYFSNTYTPLARTFPSIMSSITGLYPKNHKAEFNLSNPDYFSSTLTLPQILKQQGYHTIHATDEKRFANFTSNQGFDELLGPPDGVLDFLLGKFSDIPILNLITLFPLSEYLLPYSSINRPADYSYNPSKFTSYLTRAFANSINQHTNEPMFIFIHLCLPHYPYSWMNSSNEQSPSDNYNNAISAADEQTKTLHEFLSSSGIINKNSIQIYMSDHGESLHGDATSFSLPDGNHKIISRPGHGTDIRDIKQNQTSVLKR